MRITVLISVLVFLLCANAYGISPQDFIDKHDARIIKHCRSVNSTSSFLKENSAIDAILHLPGKYECGLTQFYAIRRNAQYQRGIDDDTYKILKDIMDKYYIEEFDTFDFVSGNIEYEEWLNKETADPLN